MNDELLSKINNSITKTVFDNKIGVAFSGGIDSTLIASICSKLGYDVTLLTIGFPNSHDVLFAQTVNEYLKMQHKILEIDNNTFKNTYQKIHQKILTDNLSWNENCIAFYYVSKLAESFELKTVVTANGIDELFCGYNSYRDAFPFGEQKIIELMESKLENELQMMKAVNSISSEFGVKIIQPLLSNDFIEYAKSIPLSQKIKGKDDLFRKHVIRELAIDIGIPKISAEKRKKALQYGSLIHKALIKIK